jgi:hypothetical protein
MGPGGSLPCSQKLATMSSNTSSKQHLNEDCMAVLIEYLIPLQNAQNLVIIYKNGCEWH